jgi:geranylgeranyl diphosphate synthase type II
MAARAAEATVARLRELVEDGLRELDLAVPADVAGLDEAMRYSLLAPGKRLRPVLCLASAESCGADAVDALPTALALELVHTFSLVHDDLPAMDDDDLRRGRPTAHVRYGEGVALLAGDALLDGAFDLVCRRQAGSAERRLAVVAELARAVGPAGMIGGQYLDLTADAAIGEAGLRRLCVLKTGALIEAAVACGAIVAGAPAERVASLREFAAELGVLFQVVDDLLDATGSDQTLGKTAGSDSRQGKRTHVTVMGEGRSRAIAARSRARAEQLLDEVGGDTAALSELTRLVAERSS